MSIQVRYFARLREEFGADVTDCPHLPNETVEQLWQRLNQSDLPDNVLMAIDQAYVKKHSLVPDECEVAFFPPVTGG